MNTNNYQMDRRATSVYKRPSQNPFERPKVFYDMEVFHNMWCICFIFEDGTKKHFVNNGRIGIQEIVNKYTLIGFNNFGYDDLMLTKILSGVTDPRKLKEYNDRLINSRDFNDRWFPSYDIVSLDAYPQINGYLGLKSIECYNGANIYESEIDFNYMGDFDDEMIQETLNYCYYDVEFTKRVFEGRKDYFSLKEFLYDQFCDTMPRNYRKNTTSLMNTLYSGYKKPKERVLPRKDLFEKLPEEVQKMFKHGTMTEVDDKKPEKILYSTRTTRGDFSGGGIHGTNATPQRYFENVTCVDVASLYPTIMVNFNLLGDNTQRLVDWLQKRLELKRAGNPLQETYKLLINSLYGILGAKHYLNGVGSYNVRESVCLIGQTCLYDLSLRLEDVGLQLINVNTDGIFYLDDSVKCQDDVDKVLKEWEDDYNFKLDTEKYSKIFQKDVNNYIGITPEGKYKLKGAYLVNYNTFINKDGTYVERDVYENKLHIGIRNNSVYNFVLVEFLTKYLPDDKVFKKLYTSINNIDFDVNVNRTRLKELTKEFDGYGYKNQTEMKRADITLFSSGKIQTLLKEIKELKSINKNMGVERKTLYAELQEYMLNNYKFLFEECFNRFGLLPFCARYSKSGAYKYLQYGDKKALKVNRAFMTTLPAKRLVKVKDLVDKKTGEVRESIQNFPLTTDNMELVNRPLNEYDYRFKDIDVEFYNNVFVKRVLAFTLIDEKLEEVQ